MRNIPCKQLLLVCRRTTKYEVFYIDIHKIYTKKLSRHRTPFVRCSKNSRGSLVRLRKLRSGSHSSELDLGKLQDYSRETVRISTRRLSGETRFVLVKPSSFEPTYSNPTARVAWFIQKMHEIIVDDLRHKKFTRKIPSFFYSHSWFCCQIKLGNKIIILLRKKDSTVIKN